MPPIETERLLSRASTAITNARYYQAQSDPRTANEYCLTARRLLDRAQQALAARLDTNMSPENHP